MPFSQTQVCCRRWLFPWLHAGTIRGDFLFSSQWDSREHNRFNTGAEHRRQTATDLPSQGLTLWLCSDSCHSRCVPGQKWPDSKQLLINLSLCYIITKYWIHSFCQLVFFHLGLVLCFYLHPFNRRPHLSESRLLIFWVKKSFFMNNFHNIKQKIIKNCTVSHTSVL